MGSGVIVSKDGLRADNNHVVADAQEIKVTLPIATTTTHDRRHRSEE